MKKMPKDTFHNDDAILDVYEKPELGHGILLSMQHLFAMFGSTVLVPIWSVSTQVLHFFHLVSVL